MIDKEVIMEEVIELLKPAIKKSIIQTPFEYREELQQELYLKIIKKISEEKIADLPDFFEMIEVQEGDRTFDYIPSTSNYES